MEHIETLRTLDPSTIIHGILYSLAAGVVAVVVLVKLFRSWG
jgi:hypothetical protein